ncbi:hypothetical protein [Microbacterium oleivorans]|uniref:Uncharacterized protein n=1 Tax=Microbacterium oleivorans TaxID=273677 RepID=A0A7D5EX75_9MICO|nr:hypothetical protein [Microbacterium oleivorans]QLD11028.1 hypothetical protein HW566_04040 [Microbacterium oleivorans]
MAASLTLLNTTRAVYGDERENDSPPNVVETQRYLAIPDEDQLVPLSTDADASTGVEGALEGHDGYVVSLGTDAADRVLSKEIELVRPVADPKLVGRDKLTTFRADTAGEVTLSWWDPSGGKIEWSVYRDSVRVAIKSGDSFKDQREAADETRYQIVGTWDEAQGHNEPEQFFFDISVPAIDDGVIGKTVNDAVKFSEHEEFTQAVANTNWEMRTQLNTFIPSKDAGLIGVLTPCAEQIQAGWGGYYAGDNRGYAPASAWSPSVRTGVETVFTYNSAKKFVGLSTSKRTSGTRIIRADGSVAATRNANLIKVQRVGDSGDDYGRSTTWSHHVPDPLCGVSFAIDYKITTSTSGFGDYSFFGTHDRAPSYEFRVYTAAFGGWSTAYKFNNQGLIFLAPGAQTSMDVWGNISTPY